MLRQGELQYWLSMEAAIKDRIVETQNVLRELGAPAMARGGASVKLISAMAGDEAPASNRVKRVLSAAARRRISAAQKLRWNLKRRQDLEASKAAATPPAARRTKVAKPASAAKRASRGTASLASSSVSAEDMLSLTAKE